MDAYIISRQTRDACQQSFLAGKPIIMISGNWWQTLPYVTWHMMATTGQLNQIASEQFNFLFKSINGNQYNPVYVITT